GEDFIGAAPKKQVEGTRNSLVQPFTHLLVPIWRDPASEFETASRVLLRSARRLHDAVLRYVVGRDQLSHFFYSFARVLGAIHVACSGHFAAFAQDAIDNQKLVGKGKLTHAQPTVSWSVGAIAGRYIQSP